MKELLINAEDYHGFIDNVKKYVKKLLKASDYNYFIDEIMEVIEKNKIQFHNDFLMAMILEHVDFDNFVYHKTDELFDKLKNRYYDELAKVRAQTLHHRRSEGYWIVQLVAKLVRKEAYPFLIDVIKNEDDLEVRANAMKRLSQVAKQRFDRNLPKRPGHWKPTDIRMQELDEWIAAGCPDGPGYDPPTLDPALSNPANDFERVVSKLNEKLKKNQDTTDYSSYDNFLTVPDAEQCKAILNKYNLTGLYAEFLQRFSPCEVRIAKGMYEVSLYGVDNIVKNQTGYSVDQNNVTLDGWPEHYLVIADRDADPFCIDVTKPDSKVFLANHGEGAWKFKKAYNNFFEFLEYLTK